MEKVMIQCNMCSYTGVWAEIEFFRDIKGRPENIHRAGIWSWVLNDEWEFQTENIMSPGQRGHVQSMFNEK